ncbi:MAG: hypothetical protein OEV84_02315, partial [Betaproteobacteria bacterium]|nr:hypothetical protein [Betaproteobacteria bacterium]
MITRAPSRPLLAAVLLSVAAHAALLAGSWLTLPASPPDPQPLSVRLEPLPPPPVPPAPPAVSRRPPAAPARHIAVAPRP